MLPWGSLKLTHAPFLAKFSWGTLYNLGQALNEPSWSPAASVGPGQQQVFSAVDGIRRAGFPNCRQTPRQFRQEWSVHSHRHCGHHDGYLGALTMLRQFHMQATVDQFQRQGWVLDDSLVKWVVTASTLDSVSPQRVPEDLLHSPIPLFTSRIAWAGWTFASKCYWKI